MMTNVKHFASAVLAATVTLTASAIAQEHVNDYPTVTRADYVFACMQVNGQTRDMLEKCSCSIDQIAAVMPFEDYEAAETVMSVQLKGGESVAALHYAHVQDKVKTLKRAQVEGEIRCF